MDIIFGEEFGEAFFIIGTLFVVGIVAQAYFKNWFSPRLTWATVAVLVVYMVSFVLSRYMTGEIDEQVAAEPLYMLFGALHGTIALWAVAQACTMFAYAEQAFARGENFFVAHKRASLILVILWPLALLTGFLM